MAADERNTSRDGGGGGGHCNTLPRTKGHSPRDPGRPLSVYDNHRVSPAASEGLNGKDAWVPAAQQLLATTVPQKIAPASSLSGRHTPTRNSLRHSRMIVLSRTGKVPRKYLPPVMRHHKAATALVFFQLLLGVAVLSLGIYMLIWAPDLRIRDNPCWSGGPLLLSGCFGIFLLCCCRKDYPGMPLGCCIFTVKVISVTLSIVVIATCLCASVFALLHVIFLSKMACHSTKLSAESSALNSSCICSNVPAIASRVEDLYQMPSAGRTYYYRDLSCDDVEGMLFYFLIASCLMNAVAAFVSFVYVFLHWSSRYMYVYSGVGTSDENPIVIYNRSDSKGKG
ncbi:sarcospan isoform X2 [Ischnura elegans]|uniref:sarcospan isoform X2 n=1 Tax=Ischnura elegans TaxID=197161 RepID=UPI001ED8A1D3|nr:sarcospan isoform X2 [Ischnura elegans]